jgi:hypothetical protein
MKVWHWMNRRLLLILASLVAHGCSESTPKRVDYDVEAIFDPAAYHPEWNDRNADIYRFLLSQLEAPSADRIYFITNTPPAHWNDNANWSVIPQSELDPFPNAALYHPADNAHRYKGHVRQNETNAAGWIYWISVRHWISQTEVEVEQGVYSGPLSSGGKIEIYEKTNGAWRLESTGFSWVS